MIGLIPLIKGRTIIGKMKVHTLIIGKMKLSTFIMGKMKVCTFIMGKMRVHIKLFSIKTFLKQVYEILLRIYY